MALTTAQRSRLGRALAAAACLAICAAAGAQVCDGPLPTPGAPVAGGKFGLIASQCPALAAPARVHRAAQLDLYSTTVSLDEPLATDAPPRVTPVTLPAPAEAPGASGDHWAAATGHAPLGPAGERVLALAPTLSAAARAHGLDPLLLHAIAHVESRHRADAISPAGARGLMQVMPATARRFGVTDPTRTLLDPQTNVDASAAYLRALMRRFDDDLRLVVAAYNAGEGAVEKHGRDVPPYAETQAYVRDVLALYRRLTDSFSFDQRGVLVARGSRR
jgi:soluble lytic murein transglycosylase-like protein